MTKNQTKYVDGYVLLVPKKNVDEYKKMAKDAGKIWMKHGALSYKESMLEDATPIAETLHFPTLTKAKPNETIWFSYVEYKSKAHRDKVNAAVMKEMEEYDEDPCAEDVIPFDMKKMAFGGFEVMVNAQ